MSDDLVTWFKEANGFAQGTKAPHKWVLQAEQELRFQARRIEALEANLAEQIEWVKRLADNLIAAEGREAKAVVTLYLTRRADDLREAYHRLPNEKCRIGEKRSKKSHARDAWMRAFREAAREARTTLAELASSEAAYSEAKGGKDE